MVMTLSIYAIVTHQKGLDTKRMGPQMCMRFFLHLRSVAESTQWHNLWT